MAKILAKYKNGNTNVVILEDGTKIREYKGTPKPVHPESIDCKVTNYCDLGCAFCHENSTVKGEHADLEKLKAVLISLPAGTELALGGGNPLDHPDILDFLTWCKLRGIIANMTINQGHLEQFYHFIVELIKNELIKGIGISITSDDYTYVKKIKMLSNNVVYHLIVGIHKPEILKELDALGNPKYLILGYKQFGRGIRYYSEEVENGIQDWEQSIEEILNTADSIISFDNLALEQLKIQEKIDPKLWEQAYMGDDFTFTMYIDAVNQEYAPTSRSNNRKSFNEYSLFEYFIKHRINV